MGTGVGSAEGRHVGWYEGESVGLVDGLTVGPHVGDELGTRVGCEDVGLWEGPSVGTGEGGALVGAKVGKGSAVGRGVRVTWSTWRITRVGSVVGATLVGGAEGRGVCRRRCTLLAGGVTLSKTPEAKRTMIVVTTAANAKRGTRHLGGFLGGLRFLAFLYTLGRRSRRAVNLRITCGI